MIGKQEYLSICPKKPRARDRAGARIARADMRAREEKHIHFANH